MRALIVGFVLTSLTGWAGRSEAQELSAGDIAIIGMNSDDPDEFAFVTLVDLPGGTTIKFVDHGWIEAGEFNQIEEEYIFRAASDIPAGAVITVGAAQGAMRFSTFGDQIFAYQGSDSNPLFIYALNNKGDGVWQTEVMNPSESTLPTALVSGVTAVALDECDNVAFAGPMNGGRDQLLQAIGDKSNWTCNDFVRMNLNLSKSFTGFGNRAPYFISAPSDTTITTGGNWAGGFNGVDPDGDPTTYSITPQPPEGASFSMTSGRLKWTPTPGQEGAYRFHVVVADAIHNASVDFQLVVQAAPSGTAPYFRSAPRDRIIWADTELAFTLVAIDPLGFYATITPVSIPGSSTWNGATQTFRWTPTEPYIEELIFRASGSSGETMDLSVMVGVRGELPIGWGDETLALIQQLYSPAQTLTYEAAVDTIYTSLFLDDDGFIRGIYSGFSAPLMTGDPSSAMSELGFGIDHPWPFSQGSFGESQQSDLYNMFPAQTSVIDARVGRILHEISDEEATMWFGPGPVLTRVPTDNIEAFSAMHADGLEPPDEIKGDVVRAALYFWAVYNSEADQSYFWDHYWSGPWNWTYYDPVDARELRRNKAIERIQGNINPFLVDPNLLSYITGIIDPGNEEEMTTPHRTDLLSNYPNPFHSSTTIVFDVSVAGEYSIQIYDVLGRRIEAISLGMQVSGRHSYNWSPTNLASGIYLVRMKAERGFS